MVLVILLALLVFGGTLMMSKFDPQEEQLNNQVEINTDPMPIIKREEPVNQLVQLILQHLHVICASYQRT